VPLSNTVQMTVGIVADVFTTCREMQVGEIDHIAVAEARDHDRRGGVLFAQRAIELQRADPVEGDRHRRVLIDHVGEMGETVVADVDVNVAEQLRIAADEDRAAIGV